jgi:hypothetical protein
VSASIAAQIDRKEDDGLPASGDVQAYGTSASCYTAAGTLVYAEGVISKDCGFYVKIQG